MQSWSNVFLILCAWLSTAATDTVDNYGFWNLNATASESNNGYAWRDFSSSYSGDEEEKITTCQYLYGLAMEHPTSTCNDAAMSFVWDTPQSRL
jgi:hypothetical protein